MGFSVQVHSISTTPHYLQLPPNRIGEPRLVLPNSHTQVCLHSPCVSRLSHSPSSSSFHSSSDTSHTAARSESAPLLSRNISLLSLLQTLRLPLHVSLTYLHFTSQRQAHPIHASSLASTHTLLSQVDFQPLKYSFTSLSPRPSKCLLRPTSLSPSTTQLRT